MACVVGFQQDDLSVSERMAAVNIQHVVGFDVEFVDEIKTDIITCNICELILREPVQSVPCGHRFCKSCIERFHERT